jgi:putative ABC transport system ATP-binding protein
MEFAISCRDVFKTFGTGDRAARALRGVSLDIRPGEMTLLVGPSGCGKTTLISAIAAMLTPDSGSIRVFGQEVSRMRPGARTLFRRHMVGFVFQQFNLLPALTATENASIPLRLCGASARDANRAAAHLLERLGLADQLDRYPDELSGGQQQRVAIARGLVHAPRLLVCDEPTASLDADNGQAAMALMRETALQKDRTVIVVTHDDRIHHFADRIAQMNDGRVTNVTGPTQDHAA